MKVSNQLIYQLLLITSQLYDSTHLKVFRIIHNWQKKGLHYPVSFYKNIAAIKKQKSSITLLVYTQSRASFPSWYRVPLTSLPTQNRLHSVNTSISEHSDLGFPLLIGGLVLSTRPVT